MRMLIFLLPSIRARHCGACVENGIASRGMSECNFPDRRDRVTVGRRYAGWPVGCGPTSCMQPTILGVENIFGSPASIPTRNRSVRIRMRGFGARLCGGNSRHGGRDGLSGHGRTQRLGSFMKYYLIVGEASGDLHCVSSDERTESPGCRSGFPLFGRRPDEGARRDFGSAL